MPLTHGSSPKAFSRNVAAEVHSGKPLNQSLAIAYSIKRKASAKKMAHGGAVCPACGKAHEGACPMAEGGLIEPGRLHEDEEAARTSLGVGEAHPASALDEVEATPAAMEGATSFQKALDAAKQHKSEGGEVMREARKPLSYAEGGIVEEILRGRAAHREAPEAGPAHEDFEKEGMDFSNYHSIPDPEHDDPPATMDDRLGEGQDMLEEDDADDSLAASILRDRRARRR